MRTTVTLDPDVTAKIKAEMKRTGKSFKEAVNSLLRRSPSEDAATPKKPYRVKPISIGPRPEFAWDNVSELLGQLDELERKK